MNKPAVKLPFTRSTASVLLDATRALASLAVCLSHWRALFFIDYLQLHTKARAVFIVPYLISGAGHQAVIIFFVLSGYLVGGSVLRLLARDEWSWRRYLTHRLVRLWIVLLPALIIGGVLDLWGVNSGLAAALYVGGVPNHVVGNVQASLKPLTFVGNLFFTQTIPVPTFGSNGPLWSLANEFWYYMLFPCALLTLRPKSSLGMRLINSALLIGMAWFAGSAIMLSFPLWLLGALLAGVRIPSISRSVRIAIATVYFPIFFGLSKIHDISDRMSDYLLGGATFILLMALLNASSEAPNTLWIRASRLTARFSYTLYLVHLPLLLLLAAATVHDSRWTPNLSSICIALSELILVIGFAWVLAFATEFRTDKVRRGVEAALGL